MLSQALHAQFADTANQRVADRRVLLLEAQAATPSGDGEIRIHNISRTGMLVESATRVAVGTQLEVEMPGGARHSAEVVWDDAELFGCRFARPLSQATLSAALLRAVPVVPVLADAAVLVDHDAIARLREHWNFEHEIADPGARQNSDMAPGKRLWTIIGLGVAGWTIPAAVTAWLLA